MRWMWIDRFLEFERGKRAVARKNVSIVEEQIDGYMPGCPVMPSSLIVEGLAQTAGLLVGEVNGFRDRVVLAKIGKAIFHRSAVPGDTLTYTAEVESIKTDGAVVRCVSHLGEELQAEVELVFAYLDSRFPSELFEGHAFLAMIRAFGLYDVGRTSDGAPLEAPDHLIELERESLHR